VKGPPLMLYSDPLPTVIAAGIVVPVTAMGLETWTLEGEVQVSGVNPPCSTGCVPVVTVNAESTPPMVSTAETAVLKFAAAVTCTWTCAPGETTPATEVKGPPLMLYWAPLLTLIGEGTLVLATVMALETCLLDRSTLLSGVKLKGLGVALVPVPDRLTCVVTVGDEVALLRMVRVSLRLPSLVGVKTTLIVQVWEAVRVAGQLLVCA